MMKKLMRNQKPSNKVVNFGLGCIKSHIKPALLFSDCNTAHARNAGKRECVACCVIRIGRRHIQKIEVEHILVSSQCHPGVTYRPKPANGPSGSRRRNNSRLSGTYLSTKLCLALSRSPSFRAGSLYGSHLMPTRRRAKWTSEDDERLKAMAAGGVPILKVAAAFNCTMAVIREKARKLGTPFPSIREVRNRSIGGN